MKRTSDELGGEALEEEPPNFVQRVGPAASGLKHSAPDCPRERNETSTNF